MTFSRTEYFACSQVQFLFIIIIIESKREGRWRGFGSNRTKRAVVTTDRLACLSEQANDRYQRPLTTQMISHITERTDSASASAQKNTKFSALSEF